MKFLSRALVSIAIVAVAAGTALAQGNNANPNAPGQDRVCLVTTGTPGSFNDADIVDSKWLPKKAADAQAAKDPTTLLVKDYSTDPLVVGPAKQYASAEELCNEHFD